MLAVLLDTCARSREQIASVPLGIFSSSLHLRSRLSLCWPHLQNHNGRLMYKGPSPISCYCGRQHSPLIGITDTEDFRTPTPVGLGHKFWDLCVADHSSEARFHSLGDGGQTDLAPLGAAGIDDLLSVSPALGIDSLRPVYEAWKSGNLTSGILKDNPWNWALASHPFSLLSSPCSCLCPLWKVTPVPAPSRLLEVPSAYTASPTSSQPSLMSARVSSRSRSSLERLLVQLRPRGDVSCLVALHLVR